MSGRPLRLNEPGSPYPLQPRRSNSPAQVPFRQVKRSFGSKRSSRRGLNDEFDDKHRWNQSHPPTDRDKSQLPDADRGAVRVARRAARQLAHRLRFPCRGRRREGLVLRADGIGYELALATVEPDPEAERVAYAWDVVAAALGNHPHFIRTVLEQKSFGLLNRDTITALTHRQQLHPADDRRPEHRLRKGSDLLGRRGIVPAGPDTASTG